MKRLTYRHISKIKDAINNNMDNLEDVLNVHIRSILNNLPLNYNKKQKEEAIVFARQCFFEK